MCKTVTQTFTDCAHVDFIPVTVHSDAPYCGKQEVVDLGTSQNNKKCSDCTKADKISQNTSSDEYEMTALPRHIHTDMQELSNRTNIDGTMDSPTPSTSIQPNAHKKATVSARHLPDPADVRFWRQKNGTRRFEGAFMELTAENEVKVRRVDGKKFSIKAASLCEADLEYVEDQTGVFFGDEFFKGDGFEEAPAATNVAKSTVSKNKNNIDKELTRSAHAYGDLDEEFGASDLTKAIIMSPDTRRKNTIVSRAASHERPAEVEQVPFTTADPTTKKLYTVPPTRVSMPAQESNLPVSRKKSEHNHCEADSIMQYSDVAKEYHEGFEYSDTEDSPAFADAATGVDNTALLQHQTTEPRPRGSSDEAEIIHPDMVQDYLRERNMTHSTSNMRNNPDTEPSDDDDWEPIYAPLEHSLAGVLDSAGTASNGDGGMAQKVRQMVGTQASQVYASAEPTVKAVVKAGAKVVKEKVLNEENKAWVMSGLEKGLDMGRAAVGRPLPQTQTGGGCCGGWNGLTD